MSYHTQQTSDVVSNVASNEAIHWYLQDQARIPVLSLKAEQELLQQIAADPLSDEANDARKRLVEANLYLVVHLARRYQPFGPELPDLVQEGNLALVLAAQRFDPLRGQRFKPFATRRVCWTLYRVAEKHLRERHLLEPDMEPVHPLRAQVLKALAHNTIDEQAVVFDLPEERFVSLDSLLEEIDTDDLLTDDRFSAHAHYNDEADSDEKYLAQERSADIADCLQVLTLKERLVLVHRYLLDHSQTLAEVGKTLRVSRERVRQIEERGIRKMRHPRVSRILRSLF